MRKILPIAIYTRQIFTRREFPE